MNFGYQSIIFGPRIDDLPRALDLVAAAGFSGIEFSQRYDMLFIKGEGAVTGERLRYLLAERNLTFLGLAGGTLDERMDFCDAVAQSGEEPSKPQYLYVEDCDAHILQNAAARRYRLALHPHVFMKNHRLEDASRCLASCDVRSRLSKKLFTEEEIERYGILYWMPDTAHLHIAGDSVLDALDLVPPERMPTIHLKDWNPVYGRSYHRYARGFTALGHGTVPILKVLAKLHTVRYTGWCVVELDHMQESLPLLADPTPNIHTAAQWLIETGYMSSERRRHSKPRISKRLESSEEAKPYDQDAESMLKFVQLVLDASIKTLPQCYEILARALWSLYSAHQVSIWACSAARSDMSLLAVYPHLETAGDHVLMKQYALIGKAVDTLTVEKQPLILSEPHHSDEAGNTARTNDEAVRSFQWPEVAAHFGANYVVSVPILNRFNHHHIRLLLGILPLDPAPQPNATAKLNAVDCLRIGEYIARAADISLDDMCSQSAARVNIIASKSRSLNDFLDGLMDLVRETTECEGLTIFLTNAAGDRLIVGATTGIDWARPEVRQSYGRDDNNCTAHVWVKNEPLLVWHAQQPKYDGNSHPWKSTECGDNITLARDNLLIVPIVATEIEGNTVIGVVRCRNKRIFKIDRLNIGQPVSDDKAMANLEFAMKDRIFTDDDAAILDAICHAAVPHIKLLQSDAQRKNAVAKLIHEMSMPLVALKGAMSWLRHDLEKVGANLAATFKYDYVGDIVSWSELMHRLVANAEVYGEKPENIDIQPRRILLMADVVAPVVRQVDVLLRSRDFNASSIWYSKFADIPALYLDRNRFQQVFFNLLSNSIKYAYKDPKRFRVEIHTKQTAKSFCILYRDWGPGIVEDYKDVIFDEGARGPEAVNKVVAGQGLGLWVVRRILELHGGTINVTNVYNPTEFTLELPLSLTSAPPPKRVSN